jgi:diguanylate cyclase (GGDEF)-like protein/PAS domain S-box-containing protein
LASEQRYRAVVRNLPNTAVLMFDRDLRFRIADGEELLRAIGSSKEQLEGRFVGEVAAPHNRDAVLRLYGEAIAGKENDVVMTREGRTLNVHIAPVFDGEGRITGGLSLSYDVTEMKRVEASLREKTLALEAQTNLARSLAIRDELTGLYNRRGFFELARQQAQVSARGSRPFVLFFIDVNDMKRINDELGHEQGDLALQDITEILQRTFRGADIAARLGGDEFVVFAVDVGGEQLELIAERLHRSDAAFNDEGTRRFRLSLSVGFAAYDPSAPLGLDELVALADERMYADKKRRKSQEPKAT